MIELRSRPRRDFCFLDLSFSVAARRSSRVRAVASHGPGTIQLFFQFLCQKIQSTSKITKYQFLIMHAIFSFFLLFLGSHQQPILILPKLRQLTPRTFTELKNKISKERSHTSGGIF